MKTFLKAGAVWGLFFLMAAGLLYAAQAVVDGIYFAGSTSVLSPAYPGQVVITRGDNTSPEMSIYDHTTAAWNEVPTKNTTETISGNWTLSGNNTFSGDNTFSGVNTVGALIGNVQIGDSELDSLKLNVPVTSIVRSEGFHFQPWLAVAEDFTGLAVADTNENILVLPGSQIGLIHFRFEQAFGGTFTPFSAAEAFNLSGIVDVTNNDGIDLRFGGDPTTAIIFDEDNSSPTFCEIGLTLADISATDSLYFGFHLAEGYQDAGNYAAHNTYAFFVLSDNAGDLDIVTELNGGGTLNDDTGITWADGQRKVLKVVVGADAVLFFVDGVQVTQTNALLNFDNTDRAVCGMGFLQSAEGVSVGAVVDYVAYGIASSIN